MPTKIGAFDLIEKPLSIDKIIVAINNALNFRRLEEENRYLRKKTIEKNSINGNSPLTIALKKQIAIAAPTDAGILITGENGTGKELVARALHANSTRKDNVFFAVDCGTLTGSLLESELFGYRKGAFTGAHTDKMGHFEMADGGTLFLDEVGNLSYPVQQKLLRAIQERKIQRLGGGEPISVSTRILAATNQSLEADVESGRFRSDPLLSPQ